MVLLGSVIDRSYYRNIVKLLGYGFFICLINLVLISLIMLFHFLLDHDLRIIEDWMFYYAWEIIIISKLLGLYLIFIFINKSFDGNLTVIYKKIFHNYYFPTREFYIILFSSLIIITLLGRPVRGDQLEISIFQMIISWLGIVIFFLSDILIVSFIYKNQSKLFIKILELIYMIIILYVINKLSLVYAIKIDIYVNIHMVICLLILMFTKSRLIGVTSYVMIVAAPLGSIFGMDFIWGNNFSPIKMSNSIGILECLSVLTAIGLYLLYLHKLDKLNTM